ncbi:ScbR family autoregulator-binding transcription factor [Streptomyces sp. Root369]|uniref:ScbR family autoregulator-binding transcription factor n=1 Tax=Streptomyces sp. Root369 TaxID=1736523 RepID=UPI00070C1447|nr:ScbR family autoregulator-binding transcription factor [Streptomyces sp. Root369]KQV98913.1 A-factor biosynthesis protein [Streptomyces sp. Root369]
MVRQERAEVTRSAILDGAARAFDAEGYHGTSLGDIVKEAGVTKGALYFHFGSKEELAQALVDEQFSALEPVTDTAKPGVQTVIDIVHTMARLLVADVRVRAGIRLVIDQSSKTGLVSEPYTRWIELFRECLVQAQQRGDVKADLDPGRVARLIVGSWTGLQLSSQVLSGRADLTEETTLMWEMLLPSIVPPRRLERFRPEGTALMPEMV